MKQRSDNARILRQYLVYLKDSRGRDDQTIEMAAAAIDRWLQYTGGEDFRKFHFEKVRAFRRKLQEATNVRTGKPLSAATVYSILNAMRAFFKWMAAQPGYRAKLKETDADCFSAPGNLARVATARREKIGPSIEQIKEVIAAMPVETAIQRRDRALMAFTILTGARDGAIITLKLKHVDIANRLVRQDAREVDTKRGKSIDTWLYPVGAELVRMLSDWIEELRSLGFSDDDPLFPKSEVSQGPSMKFGPATLSREHWATALPMCDIFRAAFARVGHPYANPHSFRNSLVQLAYRLKLNIEQFRAWSLNMGHESMMTTILSYGDLTAYRRAEIMKELAEGPDDVLKGIDQDELARVLAAAIKKANAA